VDDGTSYPIQSVTAASAAARRLLDNGRSTSTDVFPRLRVESTADTVGTVVGVATLAACGARVVTNIRKRRVIAEVHAEDQEDKKES